jgi:hypothetical protein
VAQAVDHLPSKREALSSNSNIAKKIFFFKRRKEEKENETGLVERKRSNM